MDEGDRDDEDMDEEDSKIVSVLLLLWEEGITDRFVFMLLWLLFPVVPVALDPGGDRSACLSSGSIVWIDFLMTDCSEGESVRHTMMHTITHSETDQGGAGDKTRNTRRRR